MIPTGIRKLDEFLSGGIPNGVIVDVFGGNGTGKTQLLLQLSINSARNGGCVLYLDATGKFRPERILEIQRQCESRLDFLERITVSRIRNTSEQVSSIKNLHDGYSLIVIDNVTDLFSYEYGNEKFTFEKNSVFMKFMRELSQFAIAGRIPVVVTNMVRTIEGKEIENMKRAIDPFTHIKIHLCKRQSGFRGEIYWASGRTDFTYKIHASGLADSSEDI